MISYMVFWFLWFMIRYRSLFWSGLFYTERYKSVSIMQRSPRFLLLFRDRSHRQFYPNLIVKSTYSTSRDGPNEMGKKSIGSVEVEKSTSFLNGTSATYVDEIYQTWKNDPKQVHKSWDIYFRTNTISSPPTLGHAQTQANFQGLEELIKLIKKSTSTSLTSELEPVSSNEKLVEDHLNLHTLIRAFQESGHQESNLDPLGLRKFALFFFN